MRTRMARGSTPPSVVGAPGKAHLPGMTPHLPRPQRSRALLELAADLAAADTELGELGGITAWPRPWITSSRCDGAP